MNHWDKGRLDNLFGPEKMMSPSKTLPMSCSGSWLTFMVSSVSFWLIARFLFLMFVAA